jgi:hypothetical protein
MISATRFLMSMNAQAGAVLVPSPSLGVLGLLPVTGNPEP